MIRGLRTLALCAALLAAAAAWAAIPSADRIARAVAETNAASGRVRPLLLDVSLRVAGGGAQAQGVLATHPTGLARLELKGPSGFIERHLLLGDDYRASRDGQLLASPHPFLPPVFLLQATSGEALSAALTSFGVQSEQVVLGRVCDHDCYVFGGRRPLDAPPGTPLRPSLWIDTSSFDALRLVRGDGTEYRLGPTQAFEKIRLPAWIEIRRGSLRARLEILRAAQAAAPAAAFQTDWLTAPAADAAPSSPPARDGTEKP
ncbi:MAG: hypothetical protein ACQGVC_16135 [Myxococcota bacterium]